MTNNRYQEEISHAAQVAWDAAQEAARKSWETAQAMRAAEAAQEAERVAWDAANAAQLKLEAAQEAARDTNYTT